MKNIIIIALLTLFCCYTEAQEICIADIGISGNSITKESTILRELSFSRGNILSRETLAASIAESKENLMNTSLFNYVYIIYEELPATGNVAPRNTSDTINCNIQVTVEERWYWWPMFEVQLKDKNTSSWFKKMDTERITYNMGGKLYNILGLGHKFEIAGMLGYETGFNFKYSGIALNKKQTAYLIIEGFHSKNKMIDYISIDNKLETYESNSVIRRNYGGAITLIHRPHHRTTNSITLSYDFESIADSVLVINPNYWGVENNYMRISQLEYNFSRDYRDYRKYPTNGYYFSFRSAIGQGNRFKLNYMKMSVEYQRYNILNDRWIVNNGITLYASARNKKAFILEHALGYDEGNITGYELYVVDGQNYIVQNNSLRYCLLDRKIVPLNFIKNWHRFNKPFFSIYAKAMFDFGYVNQSDKALAKLNGNSYTNKFLLGGGIGIDVLTYYDIVISVSYTLNSFGKSNILFGFKSDLF